MSTKQTDALKLALGALKQIDEAMPFPVAKLAQKVIREALAEQPAQEPCAKCKGLGYYDEGHECDDGSMAGGNYVECDKCKQPEFIKHEVENAYDWSEWVCPDPKSYLMKCCDCGLVHEAQFRVAKYKPAPSDECEVVSDPDLQAQFRMRRSEQWSPEDTAHRAGGLPMSDQPAQQQEPLAWRNAALRVGEDLCSVGPFGYYDMTAKQWLDWALNVVTVHAPPASKPWVGLTQKDIDIAFDDTQEGGGFDEFARAIEAKLKEKNNG